jgi:hypothetical protein
MENEMITKVKVAILTPKQRGTHVSGWYWDDNGGEPDGSLWLALEEDLRKNSGVTLVDGFAVTPYRGGVLRGQFCGWGSRNLALALTRADAEDLDTLDTDA